MRIMRRCRLTCFCSLIVTSLHRQQRGLSAFVLPESEVHGTLKSQLMLICRRAKESFSDPACTALTVTFPAAIVHTTEYVCVKGVREEGHTEFDWVDTAEGNSDLYSCYLNLDDSSLYQCAVCDSCYLSSI
jgi:hypothetical protein